MKFGNWIKKLFPFVSTDTTREPLMRICIRGDRAIATNGAVYIETKLTDDEQNIRKRDALLDPICIETGLSFSPVGLVEVSNNHRNTGKYHARVGSSGHLIIEDNLPSDIEYPSDKDIESKCPAHSSTITIRLSLDNLKKIVNLGEDGAINILSFAVNPYYEDNTAIPFKVTSMSPEGKDKTTNGRVYTGVIMPLREM